VKARVLVVDIHVVLGVFRLKVSRPGKRRLLTE
jgi:hypothetical protein